MILDFDWSSSTVTCAKPGCTNTFLHRHHIKHEYLWVAIKPKTWSRSTLNRIRQRYYEFRPSDIAHLCSMHHTEIHHYYDFEIEQDQRRRHYKALNTYSYEEAQWLMKQLKKCFEKWVKKKSPGIPTQYLRTFRDFPIVQGESEND